ncbi:UNVERIFIED_CONTAM: hypothetical protein K2H54_033685 [Gekko kuhli]
MSLQTPQQQPSSAATSDLLLPAVGDKRFLLACGMNEESLDPRSAEAVGAEKEQGVAEAEEAGKESEKLPPPLTESSTASGPLIHMLVDFIEELYRNKSAGGY